MTTSAGEPLSELAAALNLALFEPMPGGLFRPAAHLPRWPGLDRSDAIDLCDRFPMLELFLPDRAPDGSCATAGQTWEGTSDVWTQADASGEERYLQAVAASAGGRRFLVLQSLPRTLFTYQQLAHDYELAREKLERLGRELELKRREAERATQAKSEFLARMSHELRTPLNAVIGMADVLSAGPLTAEQRRCVEISQRNGIALLNLINDILDLSKVESGRIELESEVFDPEAAMVHAAEVVEAQTLAKGLWLRRSVAPGVPARLVGDAGRLRRILINLLGNSIKFTERGGIEVRVEPDPDNPAPGRLRFAVADTGIGIPADKLDAVFESFRQADSSTTRKFGGTGLRLAIAKQLVELMGGEIHVASEVGLGSTFFFTARFGLSQEPSPEGGRQHDSGQPSGAIPDREREVSGMRILLADDSGANRYLILRYLANTGSAIDIAEDGAQAVELFSRNRYDAVLMDIEMPVMDGYAATREIRRLERCSGAAMTPVLALTANAFADMAAMAADAGFTNLLTKPIRNTVLLAALAALRNPANSAAGRDIVTVDADLMDLVPGYPDKRRAEVRDYREALARADFAAIRNLAHKMKGTGSSYGLPALTVFGGQLEEAALAGNGAEISTLVDDLARYLDSVGIEYL